MKLFLVAIPLVFGCAAAATTVDPPVDTDGCALAFTPDRGVRIDNASNGRASVNSAGVVTLYYQDNVNHNRKVVSATDGLAFSAGTIPPASNFANLRDRIQLADGSWRLYQLSPTYQLNMLQSTDGITFTSSSVAYSPATVDQGTMGVYDVYRDKSGDGLTLLYLGDLFGSNNARRATSSDGGRTFGYVARNVLGDDGVGGGPHSFVDISSLALPDGRRCLYAMRGGEAIYSFASSDWITYTQSAGSRVMRTAWTEFSVAGLFDPTVIRLPDGRFRMYVTAQLNGRQGLVSATSQ